MNSHIDTALDTAGNIPAPIARLTSAPGSAVAAHEQNASNEAAAQENPIAAVDAMALCMQASAFGG